MIGVFTYAFFANFEYRTVSPTTAKFAFLWNFIFEKLQENNRLLIF